MELSAIWVVVIVLIGIAIGVYSICKGCQGLREQSAQALANLQERNGTRTQQEAAGSDSSLYHISGSSVHDKNPPNYDEIMEPPPSYEETIKLHGASCYPAAAAASSSDETLTAQVNYAYTQSDDDQLSCSPVASAAATTTATEASASMTNASSSTAVQMDAAASSSTITTSSTSSCSVTIES